ncbi:hypothetical protein VKA52_12610 [Halobacillus sp. HZG1]|uniref:hypothetical protein n=1 Tax=Halobacillus sp. HZG1 TaxID=3111769 RepID=UPI002DBDC55D|nr:hypothetical protein [Halobacillus sp. HZG1]MEC3884568.1 hypothetical protein [Halobacillus sp. HZG1]
MRESWIKRLLPDDEYKRDQSLYFLAESAILAIVLSMILLLINYTSSSWSFGGELYLVVFPVTIVIYVFLRYVFSGIEYADVFTGKEYRYKMKNILFQSTMFFVFFLVLYTLYTGIPSESEGWFDILGVSLLGFVLMFIFNLVSLKISHKKNNS